MSDTDKVVDLSQRLQETRNEKAFDKLCEIVNEMAETLLEVEGVNAVAFSFTYGDGDIFFKTRGRTVRDGIYMVGALENVKRYILEDIE